MKPHRPLRFILAGAALLALLRSAPQGQAATAPGADPGDPLNGTWRVCLDGFFDPKKPTTPRRSLPIYVVSREGTFLYALGSSPDYNQTTYPTDITGLRYDAASGKLAGAIRVKLNPDPWIPKERKPVMCAVEIEARLDLANPTNASALRGTYRGTFGTEPVTGTVSGYVYAQTLVDLAQCQLVLLLNQALLGGPEPYHNRIAVRFDVVNRQAIACSSSLPL